MPSALHQKQPAASPSALVDSFITAVKGSVVEHYLYFKLCGALPIIKDGRHALVKVGGFNPAAVLEKVMAECAIGKFSRAAHVYLKQGLPSELDLELARICGFSPELFFVNEEELEAEWLLFKGESEWFDAAAVRCRGDGKSVMRSLQGIC
ncbi:MAG: hypothetical protein V1658_01890 [Candidatus Micrarchaeota archaeon]